jgi:hypothetical protein
VSATEAGPRGRRRSGGEQPVVPEADFTAYYGLPILNGPVWHGPEIAGYLFLGGLAGASSLLAAGAHVTGQRELATRAKFVAAGAIGLGAVALVKDLGRPSRFFNMLRVLKPTSPMSIGSWLLAAYAPAAGVAAASDASGRLPRIGAVATGTAAAFGPAVATYTAALIADTAVPAWHEGFRELPFLFAGSSAMAAGGVGLLCAPRAQAAPARRLAAIGASVELVAARKMMRRLGPLAEPYRTGPAGRNMRVGQALALTGLVGAMLGRRRRATTAAAGVALGAASAFTRAGIFEAGRQSAADPKYTVDPQRRRLER